MLGQAAGLQDRGLALLAGKPGWRGLQVPRPEKPEKPEDGGNRTPFFCVFLFLFVSLNKSTFVFIIFWILCFFSSFFADILTFLQHSFF